MRQHFKLNGLVMHATPNGKSIRGEREILKIKFDKGTITTPELQKLSLFMMVEKKAQKNKNDNNNIKNNSPFKTNVRTTYTVEFNGKQLVFTVEEYERYKKVFNK